MALDKLVDSAQLDSDLEDVADAIRAKGGTSASLAFPAGFISAIGDIPTGGGGGGLSLLASGSYTKASGSNLSIPVSYSGTPKAVVVTTSAQTGMAHAVCVVKLFELELPAAESDFSDGVLAYRAKTTAEAYSYGGADTTKITLTSSTLSCLKISNAANYADGNYNWYIYGEASS